MNDDHNHRKVTIWIEDAKKHPGELVDKIGELLRTGGIHYERLLNAPWENYPLATEEATPSRAQEHIFTFGWDHKHPLTGQELGGCFVRVPGDRVVSRQRMFGVFGREWAFQYPSEQDAGVEKYELVEIEWPKDKWGLA